MMMMMMMIYIYIYIYKTFRTFFHIYIYNIPYVFSISVHPFAANKKNTGYMLVNFLQNVK